MKELIAAIVFAAAVASVNAEVVTGDAKGLQWDAPTTNTDGSPLQDLAGYKIYQDDTLIGDVVAENFEWADFPLIHGATSVFYVTAYDAAGNESAPSTPLTITADLVTPSAPTSITITITLNVP